MGVEVTIDFPSIKTGNSLGRHVLSSLIYSNLSRSFEKEDLGDAAWPPPLPDLVAPSFLYIKSQNLVITCMLMVL
jgi:hypothetical protein